MRGDAHGPHEDSVPARCANFNLRRRCTRGTTSGAVAVPLVNVKKVAHTGDASAAACASAPVAAAAGVTAAGSAGEAQCGLWAPCGL